MTNNPSEAIKLTRNFDDYPQQVFDGKFELVQPRLNGGAVYKGDGCYLRLGEREVTMTEEIQTRALRAKGFPVARVLEHGELLDQWYFTEESLGDEHLGNMFAKETQETGEISEESFGKLMNIMEAYAKASLGTQNRAKHGEQLRDIVFFERLQAQYPEQSEASERAMCKVESRVASLPVGIINADLGAYNILPRGMIDFEFLHTGPLGYDVASAPLMGCYFPDAEGFRHLKTHQLSPDQFESYYGMIDAISIEAGLQPVTESLQEIIMLKTIWAAIRPLGWDGKPYEDIERERFWAVFRSNILKYAISQYEKDQPIDFQSFSRIGERGEW